jgi:hypothetical protein
MKVNDTLSRRSPTPSGAVVTERSGSSSTGSSRTSRTRAQPESEKGIAESTKPIRRNGNTSNVNRKMKLVSSPTLRSPLLTR